MCHDHVPLGRSGILPARGILCKAWSYDFCSHSQACRDESGTRCKVLFSVREKQRHRQEDGTDHNHQGAGLRALITALGAEPVTDENNNDPDNNQDCSHDRRQIAARHRFLLVLTTSAHCARPRNSARRSPTARRTGKSPPSGTQRSFPACRHPSCGSARPAKPPRGARSPSTSSPRTEAAAFSGDNAVPEPTAAPARAAWHWPRHASASMARDEETPEPSACPCRRRSGDIPLSERTIATTRYHVPDLRFGPPRPTQARPPSCQITCSRWIAAKWTSERTRSPAP